jgi:four helix bundle protein
MDKPRQNLTARAFELSKAVFALYPRLASASPAHAHLAHQLLRSATAIGALLEEGAVANSRRDMALKYAIALREAREANYWSRLGAADRKWTTELEPIVRETREFVAMLTVSVRKLRSPVAAADHRHSSGLTLQRPDTPTP